MLKFCVRAADPVYASEIHEREIHQLLCCEARSVAMFAVSAACKGYPGAASI
jgi:hypothetical protein